MGFAITTNGALLNQEISIFLIKNKFSIAISLDGYKSNHDRNRKLADGSPSFDIVWENIKMLRKVSADNPVILTFLCCIDSYTNLLELADFFHSNYDTLWPCSIRINPVNQLDTNYYHYCDEVYANSDTIIKQNHSKALEILKERMITNYYGSHTKEILSPFFAAELGIFMGTVGIPRGPLNNSCIPGSKITILPDGRITPCEKVGDSFVIGTIYDGIDIDIIQKYCNHLLAIMEQQGCNKCQIRRLCSICFSYLNENANIKEGFCNMEKESKIKVLTEICNNLEDDPNYYDIHINNYKSNFEYSITEEE